MKIHKQKSRMHARRQMTARKSSSRLRPVLSVLGTIVLVCGLVVAGYMLGDSVLGLFGIEVDRAESTDSASAVSDSAEQVTADTTTTSTTTGTTTTAESQATTTTTTTQSTAEFSANAADFTGKFLSADALENAETLNAALDIYSAGETVILPLKIEGGALLYASGLEAANQCGAVQGEMTLEEIAACLRTHQLTAIVQLSVLNDNLYPAYDHQAGYFFADEYTRWLDDKAEEGGKPWLSPFSDAAIRYLQSIVAELNQAGFLHILCDDVTYPDFYDTDLEHIGKKVQDKELRREALVNVLNGMQKTAQENGGSIMTQFSMYAAMNRDVEFLSSSLLDAPNAVVLIDMHSFRDTLWYGNEQLAFGGKSVTEVLNMLLPIAEDMTGEAGVIPCLKCGSLSDAEESEAISALQALGYTRYCLK